MTDPTDRPYDLGRIPHVIAELSGTPRDCPVCHCVAWEPDADGNEYCAYCAQGDQLGTLALENVALRDALRLAHEALSAVEANVYGKCEWCGAFVKHFEFSLNPLVPHDVTCLRARALAAIAEASI